MMVEAMRLALDVLNPFHASFVMLFDAERIITGNDLSVPSINEIELFGDPLNAVAVLFSREKMLRHDLCARTKPLFEPFLLANSVGLARLMDHSDLLFRSGLKGFPHLLTEMWCQTPNTFTVISQEYKSSDPSFKIQNIVNAAESPCLNNDFTQKSAKAIVTRLPDELASTIDSVIKLARSIRAHMVEEVDLILLTSSTNVPARNVMEGLSAWGWQRCVMANQFDELEFAPSKINIWNMHTYQKALFLDSDTLVVGDLFSLFALDFEVDRIGAAPKYKLSTSSSGFDIAVLLVRPDRDEYKRLLLLRYTLREKFWTEDQLFNEVYKYTWVDIGFEHNADIAAYIRDPEYWAKHSNNLKILHYSVVKPWRCKVQYSNLCRVWNDM